MSRMTGVLMALALSAGYEAQAGGWLQDQPAPGGIAWIIPEILAAESDLYVGLQYSHLALDAQSRVNGFSGPNPISLPISFGFPSADGRLLIGTRRAAHGVFLGAEIGVSMLTHSATGTADLITGGGIGQGNPTSVTFTNRLDLGRQVDVRLILGAEQGDFSIFGTAGLAGRSVTSTLSSSDVGTFATAEDVLVAPTYSIGVERQMSEITALRLELQRTAYGPFDFAAGNSPIPQLNGSSRVDLDETRFQVGLTFRY